MSAEEMRRRRLPSGGRRAPGAGRTDSPLQHGVMKDSVDDGLKMLVRVARAAAFATARNRAPASKLVGAEGQAPKLSQATSRNPVDRLVYGFIRTGMRRTAPPADIAGLTRDDV